MSIRNGGSGRKKAVRMMTTNTANVMSRLLLMLGRALVRTIAALLMAGKLAASALREGGEP